MDETRIREQIKSRLEELKKNDPIRIETLRTTVEQRMRNTVEKTTRELKEHAHNMGKEMSDSQARKTASDLANSIHREDQQKGKR